MTGLRVPPGPASGARPDEGSSVGARIPPAGESQLVRPVGWARWGWRQLTSMRTALVLLFLLAVGSVPGSSLPQQGIDPAAVQQYYSRIRRWPLARRFPLHVFAAPWFAAIYLLLFASLAGCLSRRSVRLVRSALGAAAARAAQPGPAAPVRPARGRPRPGGRPRRRLGRAAPPQVPAPDG